MWDTSMAVWLLRVLIPLVFLYRCKRNEECVLFVGSCIEKDGRVCHCHHGTAQSHLPCISLIEGNETVSPRHHKRFLYHLDHCAKKYRCNTNRSNHYNTRVHRYCFFCRLGLITTASTHFLLLSHQLYFQTHLFRMPVQWFWQTVSDVGRNEHECCYWDMSGSCCTYNWCFDSIVSFLHVYLDYVQK